MRESPRAAVEARRLLCCLLVGTAWPCLLVDTADVLPRAFAAVNLFDLEVTIRANDLVGARAGTNKRLMGNGLPDDSLPVRDREVISGLVDREIKTTTEIQVGRRCKRVRHSRGNNDRPDPGLGDSQHCG